jgi:hypothetical protein
MTDLLWSDQSGLVDTCYGLINRDWSIKFHKQQAALISKSGLWPFGRIRPELLAPALCGRTGRELLRARHLTFSASHRLLRAPRCPPCAGHRFDSVPNAYALRRSRISPLPKPRARAGHGSLRATDCSVVQHFGTPPRLRIAPYSTLSALRRSRIAPLSSSRTLDRSRIAPISVLGSPRRSTDFSVL